MRPRNQGESCLEESLPRSLVRAADDRQTLILSVVTSERQTFHPFLLLLYIHPKGGPNGREVMINGGVQSSGTAGVLRVVQVHLGASVSRSNPKNPGRREELVLGEVAR